MQVRDRAEQYKVLLEAVQNQNPQVVVVDEIGTSQEVEAVRTITQRGVAMVRVRKYFCSFSPNSLSPPQGRHCSWIVFEEFIEESNSASGRGAAVRTTLSLTTENSGLPLSHLSPSSWTSRDR